MVKQCLGSITLMLAAGGWALADPGVFVPRAGSSSVPHVVQAQGEKPAAAAAADQKPAETAAPIAAEGSTTLKDDLRDDHQGPEHTLWGGADYLFWWTKSAQLPVPLASSSPAGSQGILGQPGAAVILGQSSLSYEPAMGGRLTVGGWLNCRNTVGLEFSGFLLEEKTNNSTVASDAAGAPLLARPFLDIVTGAQSANQVAVPGAFSGGIAVNSSTGFWGAETNLVRNLSACQDFHADLLLGFRYLDLEDNMNIFSNSTALAGGTLVFNGQPLPQGTGSITLADRFATRSQFYGGQIGGRAEVRRGIFFAGFVGKVALGPTHESISVSGSTTLNGVGATQSAAGGLLALNGANIGRSTTNWFTIVPEGQLQLGAHLTDHLEAFVGYSFLYMSNVIRPGSQINTAVNQRFVPTSTAFGSITGDVQPTRLLRQDDFWAQGISLGVAFKY